MSSNNDGPVSRRELLGRGSALALGLLMGSAGGLQAEELIPDPRSDEAEADEPPATPVVCAVIGLGDQGRALLTALSYVPGASVGYVCDSYAAAHKRALEIQPKSSAAEDYHKVLDDKAVQAVFVATPSHLHRQIVLDALAAGKHVYCEAPLASSIEDARAIAKAALAAAPKQVFHAGLPMRTNPQHNHVLQFVRTGALGQVVQTKGTWHKKTNWRRTAPTDERQNALNWRLSKATSGGLAGEIGIHAMDVTNWFLKATPTAVSGFGGIVAWKDGRDVSDTIQCILEYPNGVHFAYDATLGNSYDGAYELFQGMESAILVREQRAWMFKEADAKALGWEVYAYKEKLGDETGIALVADATKLLAAGKEPGKNRDTDPTRGPFYWSCKAFLDGVRTAKPTDAGPAEGLAATVTALTANQAILTGSRIPFTKEMFDIG
jgi:predicted dehydrogenase